MEKQHLSSEMISKILEKQIESANGYAKYQTNEEKQKRWIYLLSSATGSGKSYSIAHVMGKYSKPGNRDKRKRFVYIVHTKENLRDIHQKLLKQHPDTKDDVLLLKSEAEMIVEFFDRLDRRTIDVGEVSFLNDFKNYDPLKSFIQMVILKSKNQSRSINDHRETITQYTGKLKRELRSFYQNLLIALKKQKKAGDTKNSKVISTKIKEFEEQVGIIFPTANLEKYSIVFTTTHRFMRSVWRLKSSRKLYDMEIFKNQFLIIDEIDAQKKKMLNILAESASEEVLDKISLFASIHHTLTSSSFLPKYGVNQKDADEIISFFDEIYQRFFKKFSFVYKVGEDDKNSKYILRSDLAKVVEDNIKKLMIKRDNTKHLNYVAAAEKKEAEDEEPLLFEEMIYQIDRALARLVNQGSAVVIQAVTEKLKEGIEKNEWQDLEEQERKRLEDFIRDLEFSPEDDEKKYGFMRDNIMHYKRLVRRDRKKQLTTYAEGFYPKGFSIVEAVSPDDDDRYERMRSAFRFYTLLDTPEYILQAVSAKMFTIGISATATLKTVVNNFDFDYLRDTMVPVLTLSPDEIEKLNTLYIRDNRQEHRPIYTFFTDDEEKNIPRLCEQYFNSDPRALPLLKSISDRLSFDTKTKPGKTSYQFKRYQKYMELYWRFLTDTNITSFLVFVNKLPKNSETDTMKDDLEHLFGMMIETNLENPLLRKEAKEILQNRKDLKDELFYVVDAETKKQTYEENIEKKILSANRAAFVFTTYETVGSGANLDYEVIMSDGSKRRRDYSAVYLEKPTHIIPRGGKDDNNYAAEMIKSIYFVHALYASNDISYSEFKRSLRYVLSGNMMNIPYKEHSEDFINAVMSILIQAIGRCHRVNNPDDPLTIVADSELLNIVANFDAGSIALLPSVAKLLACARDLQSGKTLNSDASVTTRQIERNSNRLNKKIEHLLRYIRTNEDYANEFSDFRNHLLCHPTKNSVEQNRFAILYSPPIKDKIYWYKTEDDFSTVDVIMKKGNSGSWAEVSDESSGLPLVRSMPRLKRYFEDHGYATAFKHNCLLTPVAFNNFYKGILGETIGSFVFRHDLGIEIEPLGFESGFFEFFDFVSENGIYVDFKYYSTGTLLTTTEEEVRSNAAKKLKSMGGQKGMIVNIYYRGKPENPSREITFEDDIFIVPFIIDASDPNNPVIDRNMAKKLMEIFNG